MSLKVLFILTLVSYGTASAQWSSIDPGLSGRVRALSFDPGTDRLYCFGHFTTAGALTVNGTAFLVDGLWNGMGAGIDNPAALPPVASAISGDTLVVSGFFQSLLGVPGTRSIALWDGNNWSSLGAPGAIGVPWSLEYEGADLIVCGQFDSIAGAPYNSIARFNNGTWEALCSFPSEEGSFVSYSSSEIYQGDMFIAGNINGIPELNEIGRLVNDTLRQVGGGILGDSWVNSMVVYGDHLYVAGEFYLSDGNAASGLMRWNGSTWNDPFPGLTFTNQVHEVEVFEDRLFFSGQCRIDGEEDHYQLGVFDGQRLCLFGKSIDAVLSPFQVLNDTLMAVAPNVSSLVVNGTSLGRLAEYDLRMTDTCIAIHTGIETSLPGSGFDLFFDEGSQILRFRGLSRQVGNVYLDLFDATGRIVLRAKMDASGPGGTLETVLPALTAGLYIARINRARGDTIFSKRFFAQ